MLTTEHRLDRPTRFRTDSKKLAEPTFIAPFETELNWMAIAWREDTLVANMFGYPSRRLAELALARIPGMPQSFCRVTPEGQVDDVPQWVSNLIAKLKLYAAGEKVEMSRAPSTARSWLPARQTELRSRISAVQASGSAP